MPEFLYPLLLLACPLAMGVMMWIMMRGGRGEHGNSPSASQAEVDALRKEVHILRAGQQGRSLGLFKE